jgi:Flp pilus assembly protein TadD
MLGDLAAAIEGFTAALELDASLASSLYGRGIARQRNGDLEGARSDMAAAKALKAGIADEFASYGVKMAD